MSSCYIHYNPCRGAGRVWELWCGETLLAVFCTQRRARNALKRLQVA